jgi:hypothetical protein
MLNRGELVPQGMETQSLSEPVAQNSDTSDTLAGWFVVASAGPAFPLIVKLLVSLLTAKNKNKSINNK